jgi:hypothetical protein
LGIWQQELTPAPHPFQKLHRDFVLERVRVHRNAQYRLAMRARVACARKRAARHIRDIDLLRSDAPDDVLTLWTFARHRRLSKELSIFEFEN